MVNIIGPSEGSSPAKTIIKKILLMGGAIGISNALMSILLKQTQFKVIADLTFLFYLLLIFIFLL